MKKASGADSLEAFSLLTDNKQAAFIRKMRSAGASLRQLSRLTGIGMAVIRRMLADGGSKPCTRNTDTRPLVSCGSVPKTTLPLDRYQHGVGQEDAGSC